MKVRTVKKAYKALRDGRRTPPMRRVTLDHVSEVAYIAECKHKRDNHFNKQSK